MSEKRKAPTTKNSKKSKAAKANPQRTLLHHFTKKAGSSRDDATSSEVNDFTDDERRGESSSSRRATPPPPSSDDPIALIPHASEHASSLPTSSEEVLTLGNDASSDVPEIVPTAPPSPIPPSLARSVSIEGQTRNDPIVLEDSSPVKPSIRSPRKSKPSQPLHPFFAPRKPRLPANKPSEGSSQINGTLIPDAGGESHHDAILVESSPPPPPKHVHPFFARRTNAARGSSPASPIKSTKRAEPLATPFPSHESQHVRGPQSDFPRIESSWHRSTRLGSEKDHNVLDLTVPPLSLCPSTSSWDSSSRCSFSSSYSVPPADEDIKDRHPEIPLEHLNAHPIIERRMLDYNSHLSAVEDGQHRLWTDKWRPRSADEVLGNEESAVYLRDWLKALEITFSRQDHTNPSSQSSGKGGKNNKRQRVVRAVERRKKRRTTEEEDEWIVPTDEETEEEFYQAQEEEQTADEATDPQADDQERHSSVVPSPMKPSRRKRRTSRRVISSSPAPEPRPPSPPLTLPENPGRVFRENVFPTLTNTILLVGPPGCGKTAAVYACSEELGYEVFEVFAGIGRRNGASLESLVGEVGKNHLVRKAGHFTTPDASSTLFKGGKIKEVGSDANGSRTAPNDFGFLGASTGAVRQSLILFEEVDILFKEDTNFWPTVIKLIKECKRPVICTCNDISLVPTQDLPLQNILTFGPSPTAAATSYLQTMCFSEGLRMSRGYLEHVYAGTSCDGDLRRAIQALQLGAGQGHACRVRQGKDWDLERSHSIDMLSYMDSHLHNPKVLSSSILDGGGAHSEVGSLLNDEEQGHPILRVDDEDGFGNGGFDGDRARMAIASYLSRGVCERVLASRGDGYIERVRQMLGRATSQTATADELVLEYLPYLRAIVYAEDLQERRHAAGVAQTSMRRTTRNSRWASFERLVPVTSEARKILSESALGGSEEED